MIKNRDICNLFPNLFSLFYNRVLTEVRKENEKSKQYNNILSFSNDIIINPYSLCFGFKLC